MSSEDMVEKKKEEEGGGAEAKREAVDLVYYVVCANTAYYFFSSTRAVAEWERRRVERAGERGLRRRRGQLSPLQSRARVAQPEEREEEKEERNRFVLSPLSSAAAVSSARVDASALSCAQTGALTDRTAPSPLPPPPLLLPSSPPMLPLAHIRARAAQAQRARQRLILAIAVVLAQEALQPGLRLRDLVPIPDERLELAAWSDSHFKEFCRYAPPICSSEVRADLSSLQDLTVTNCRPSTSPSPFRPSSSSPTAAKCTPSRRSSSYAPATPTKPACTSSSSSLAASTPRSRASLPAFRNFSGSAGRPVFSSSTTTS